MKKKDVQKLKKKTAIDLRSELNDANEKMRVLRFELSSGKVKNSAAIRDLRKKIARINTFMNVKSNESTKEVIEK